MKFEISKKNKIIIYSVLLTFGLSLMIFLAGGMFPGGKHVFMQSDMYYQYLHTINMFLRKLVHNQSLDYSFDFGLGMPTESIYAGYSLSPFNILFLCISDFDTAAFVVTIVKISLAAGAFSFLTTRLLKVEETGYAVFSCFYALGGYSVNFSSCIVFLDGLYVLPVLIYALYRFVHKGRWRMLSFVYMYIFIVQIYSGYIIGIFSALIFIIMILQTYWGKMKQGARYIGKYTVCVMIAFLLSACVILPEISGIIKYSQADLETFMGVKTRLSDVICSFFLGNMVGIYNTSPAVYSGVAAFILVPVFFLQREIDRKYKIGIGAIIAFLLACTLWGPAYLFMHGFNNPDGHAYRFSYFWTFVIVYTAVWAYKMCKEYSKKAYFIGGSIVVSLIYGGLLLLRGDFSGDKSSALLLYGVNVCFILMHG